MKKIIFALIFLALIMPVFSQDNSRNTTDMYYINVPIEKIYQTGQGYVILYRKGTNQIGTVSIPYEWFTDSAGRAEMMRLPSGPDWPTMSVFYKSGEFSHVRVYVHRLSGHRTWGLFPGNVDTRQYFTDTDTFNIEY
jgi:hypothetical protein